LTKKGKKRIINEIATGFIMKKIEITDNVKRIKTELSAGNPFGEKVLLCAATKMQSAEDINYAIEAGVDAVAENKPQEFRDKHAFLLPCPRHFIGHLQTNKIKYLLGKIELYHSCDREDLAQALARASANINIVSNVLIQINIGQEESKGGYAYDEAKEVFTRLSNTEGLCVKGFMAMLPENSEEGCQRDLVRKMRGCSIGQRHNRRTWNIFPWA
jgi:uncharacterized pyridoxal phosphate-containing UPF0001 family protein